MSDTDEVYVRRLRTRSRDAEQSSSTEIDQRDGNRDSESKAKKRGRKKRSSGEKSRSVEKAAKRRGRKKKAVAVKTEIESPEVEVPPYSTFTTNELNDEQELQCSKGESRKRRGLYVRGKSNESVQEKETEEINEKNGNDTYEVEESKVTEVTANGTYEIDKLKNATYEIEDSVTRKSSLKGNLKRSLKPAIKKLSARKLKKDVENHRNSLNTTFEVEEKTKAVKQSETVRFISPVKIKAILSQKKITKNTSLHATSQWNTSGNRLYSSEKKFATSTPGGEVSNSKPKRTKMPNYALIHQRALENVESLADHMTRKAERAKLLLSGKKVVVGNPTDANSRKHLNFTTPKKDLTKKSVGFSVANTVGDASPKTPTALRSRIQTPGKSISKLFPEKSSPETPMNTRKVSPKKAVTPKVSPNKTKKIYTPVIKKVSPMKNTSTAKKLAPSIKKTISPSKRSIRADLSVLSPIKRPFTPVTKHITHVKKTVSPKKRPARLPASPKKVISSAAKKVFYPAPIKPIRSSPTKHKFKFASDSINKKDIKATTKNAKSTTAERRNAVKGIRTNRRFELLMEMRLGKNKN